MINVTVTIGTIRSANVGEKLVADLLSISPDSRFAPGSFLLGNRSENDPVVQRVLERLQRAGMRPIGPMVNNPDPKQFYMLSKHRSNEPAELRQLELLQVEAPFTGANLVTCGRTTLGYIGVDHSALIEGQQPTTKMAFAFEGYCVRQHAKDLLERSSLAHVAFKPTVLRDEGRNFAPCHDWAAVDAEPWWELTANVHMPPLSLGTDLVYWRDRLSLSERDRRGEVWNDGVLPVEGLFARPELRYRRRDLNYVMGRPWDVARVYEPCRSRSSDYRPLICSQRFYRFCIEHGIEAEWVPVRIEE